MWPIDRTLSSVPTPSQRAPGSDSYKVLLSIPQSSSVTAASPSDLLYPGHTFEESYPSVEMQSVYSAAQADWAITVPVLSIAQIEPFNYVQKAEW